MDPRLKFLATIAAIGAIAILGSFAWFWWATCVFCQFGDPAAWPEHVTDINNIAFRYPPGFEIIVPENETENPVSVVKAGERGESVLFQVGTWRPGEEFENIEQVGDRYELAVSRRTTSSRENFDADGNPGVLLVQDETGSNRRIIEAFVIDTLGQGGPTSAPREISLQLPGTATAVERALYEKVFRALVASLDFLRAPGDENDNRPEGIPESWREYRNEDAGFSLWHAPDWTQKRIVFSSPDGAATYSVLALPQDQSIALDALDRRFSKEVTERAVADSLVSEGFSLPESGLTGISYEARVPKAGGRADPLLLRETTDLSYLVVLIGGEERGYVIEALFSGGEDKEKIDSATARRMTRTFRLLPK